MLAEHKSYIFTLIQKFNKEVEPDKPYTPREDIIVISDEAHRTQYETLAINMRAALVNASFIGFTGTPLFKDDQITRRVFGDYTSTYDFQRAVDDNATVPLFYDPRGDLLGVATHDLNEKVAEKIEQIEGQDVDVQERLEKEIKREYHVIAAQERLDQIAKDFVQHYSNQWENGKVMLVCLDKIICVRMYNLIVRYWNQRTGELKASLSEAKDEQDEIYLRRQIAWMKETEIAVVISEEQGEVDKFRKWDLDIIPHRKLIKDGFELADGKRLNLDSAFKKEGHPFRIAIVCAMWMTGFDVPCLSTLYLDKALKAHTLMQAIARANRVNEGKNNGLVIDYCGILKNLREALATFAGQSDSGRKGKKGSLDPTKPQSELLEQLKQSVLLVRNFLSEKKASLDDMINKEGFERNAAFLKAKEAANINDETRKRFEAMCREVFKKYKFCVNIKEVSQYRKEYRAINVIYKMLQIDRDKADITDIIKELHELVGEAIRTSPKPASEPTTPFDISKIDFERLRQEFKKSPTKNTTVQNLRQAIENRVSRMLHRNPLRTNFQDHLEKIVKRYNDEKDRVTIETTFQELLKFMKDLDEEEHRAIRENLDEETLAIFDILKKPELKPKEIKEIKKVAVELLKKLKTEKLIIDHWTEKESSRDSIITTIHDFLFQDKTGLPLDRYNEDEVKERAEEVYKHVLRVYPTLPSPYYAEA